VTPPPATAPATSPTEEQPSAVVDARNDERMSGLEASLADLSARLETLATQVQEMRAAPPSRDWEGGIKSLEGLVNEVQASLAEMKTRSVSAEVLLNDVVSAIKQIMPWCRGLIEEQIQALKVPMPRKGSPGELVERKIAQQVEALSEKAPEKSRLEKRITDMQLLKKPF
jgi:hypothetical protein